MKKLPGQLFIWWLSGVAALAASSAETWLQALAVTSVRCDAHIVFRGVSREQGIRATLAAVRAKHSELVELQVVSVPPEVGANVSNLDHAPDRELPAADVLRGFAGPGVRIEITDQALRIVRVDGGAERLRWEESQQARRAAFSAALRTGRADGTTLSLAERTLLRPREVASGGIGYAGITTLAEFAFSVVRLAPDAAQRFAAIERAATTEGKIYARAGLLAAGWSVAELDRLPPLSGTASTMAGCLGRSEDAAIYVRTNVIDGRFAAEIAATVQGTLERQVEFARVMENLFAEERAKLARPAPAPLGFVLAEEAPLRSVIPVDLMADPN